VYDRIFHLKAMIEKEEGEEELPKWKRGSSEGKVSRRGFGDIQKV